MIETGLYNLIFRIGISEYRIIRIFRVVKCLAILQKDLGSKQEKRCAFLLIQLLSNQCSAAMVSKHLMYYPNELDAMTTRHTLMKVDGRLEEVMMDVFRSLVA
jgi:hypothetical protein